LSVVISQVVPVQLGHIAEISQMRVSVPEDLKAANSRASVLVSLRKFLSQHKGDLPRLDPITDMDIRDAELEAAVERIQELEAKLVANPFYKVISR
jgi:ATP-dependent RNA helicase DOB1